MILSRYCVRKLAVVLPTDVLLTRETLDAQLSLDAAQRDAHERIHTHLQSARRHRHRMRARDRRLFAQRQRSHTRREHQRMKEAEAQGRRSAMQWLVSEQHWETQVMQRLMTSVGRTLADHLQAMMPEMDWSETLVQQLPALMENMDKDTNLVLRVPDAAFARATEKLAAFPLQLAPTEAGDIDIAVLESDLMRVEIPLGRQLDDVIKQLHELAWEGEDDGRN